MAEVVSRVCDQCGNVDASTYGITQGTAPQWLVDLCDSCAEPIRSWRQVARAGQGAKRRPYRRFQKTDASRIE